VMPRRSASCRSLASISSGSFTVVRFMVCQHTASPHIVEAFACGVAIRAHTSYWRSM
jgi:hypothetical protein